jgi:hypothetical protein
MRRDELRRDGDISTRMYPLVLPLFLNTGQSASAAACRFRGHKRINTAGLPTDAEHASSPPIAIDRAAALSRNCRLQEAMPERTYLLTVGISH